LEHRLIGFVGIFVFLGLAYLLSANRRRVSWRVVIWGTILQWTFALLALGIPALNVPGPFRWLFNAANDGVNKVLDYTLEGSRFIFGDLMAVNKFGFIFAFQVLPTIIFMASLMAVLYQLGIIQPLVKGLAVAMQKFMGTSGAESLSAAANIFVGQTEAPLVVKPFVKDMTNSELLAVMVGGMASVAGGVLAAYTGMLREQIPDIAGHLLTVSFMSAPSSLVIAKLLMPETEKPVTLGKIPREATQKAYTNTIEAAAGGAAEGLTLALNVAGMLLAFIALIALINGILGVFGDWIGFANWGQGLSHLPSARLSFEMILGWLFAPLAWFMGIPWSECLRAGSLLGEKTVLNEFVAYLHLAEQGPEFSTRSAIILSYALCGFANFSSIAIQIGGIGGIAPNRKKDLARLGIISVVGGTLSTFMMAAIAGVLL
jgi:concentrative nucleoside transporter, CNT family